ncbi:MAG TPA: hypothetical protein VG389_15345 [Myxococcota bacterium]|jgi:phage protein D|nr:hypothetical protein [Myxococcota bacterium]
MASGKELKKLVPDFDVTIEGKKLEGKDKNLVQDVVVDMAINAPDMFHVTFNNNTKANQGQWIDSQAREGVKVRIDMGYQGEVKTLLNGEVTGHEAQFYEDQPTLYTIRGFDFLHRLTRGRFTRSWQNMKDSGIASEVIKPYGLSPGTIEDTPQLEYIFINNDSYFNFLRERASRYNFEIDVDEQKKFNFRKPKNAESEVVTLRWEEDLMVFEPRLSTVHQVSKVVCKGWDPKTKKEIIGKSETAAATMGGSKDGSALVKATWEVVETVIVDKPIYTQEEADKIAAGKLYDRQLDLITGQATAKGDPDLKAGTVVKIENVGERYSGTYYVTNALHMFHNGGYTTTFNFRRSGIGDGAGKVAEVVG